MRQGGAEILPLLKAHGIQVLRGHIDRGGMFALDGWLINVMKQAHMCREHPHRHTTFHSTETRDEPVAEIARHGGQGVLCIAVRISLNWRRLVLYRRSAFTARRFRCRTCNSRIWRKHEAVAGMESGAEEVARRLV